MRILVDDFMIMDFELHFLKIKRTIHVSTSKFFCFFDVLSSFFSLIGRRKNWKRTQI